MRKYSFDIIVPWVEGYACYIIFKSLSEYGFYSPFFIRAGNVRNLILESWTFNYLSTPSTWFAAAPSNYYSPRIMVSRNILLFSPFRVISCSNNSTRLVIATLQLKFNITTRVSKRSVGSNVDFSKLILARELPWSKQHQLVTLYSTICIIKNSKFGGSSVIVRPFLHFDMTVVSSSTMSTMRALTQYFILAFGC